MGKEENGKILRNLFEKRMVLKHFQKKMVESYHSTFLNALLVEASNEISKVDDSINELVSNNKVSGKDLLGLIDYPPAINLDAKR